MRQYDVIENPLRRRMPDVPFLLILQHERNFDSANVIAAPLSTRAKSSRREVALNVTGRPFVLLPMELTSLPRSLLQGRPIANLAHESYRIQTALDIVFSAAG